MMRYRLALFIAVALAGATTQCFGLSQSQMPGVTAPARRLATAAASANVPATMTAAGDFDYGAVIGLSLLFYEAQRAGFLPPNQRVAWRGNAALQDKTADGKDLVGGYFDAGDYVKFNLPQAFTIAVLAWSVLEFKDGYVKAGELQHALEAIKWGADYLIKCDLGGRAAVAQVGSGNDDHKQWRRPEDIREQRPVFVCTPAMPGSDVSAAMAAALAATSLVFKDTDKAYAATCLSAARSLYGFASHPSFLGRYTESNCSSDAASFYKSNSMYDELAWAAAWLHWATGDATFLGQASKWWLEHVTKEAAAFEKYATAGFFWDTTAAGAALLLSRQLPSNQQFNQHLYRFFELWTSYKGNRHVVFSNKGFAWYTQDQGWGSLRHMSNAAFLLLVYAKQLGVGDRDKAVCLAHGQLRYALGDAGRSFVVGYGNDPPQRAHHRSSSCPPAPEVCDYRQFTLASPNPRVLYGALVGGPDPSDIYRDRREDAMSNEVAIDYNAGFTGALAGLSVAPISYRQCELLGLQRQKKG